MSVLRHQYLIQAKPIDSCRGNPRRRNKAMNVLSLLLFVAVGYVRHPDQATNFSVRESWSSSKAAFSLSNHLSPSLSLFCLSSFYYLFFLSPHTSNSLPSFLLPSFLPSFLLLSVSLSFSFLQRPFPHSFLRLDSFPPSPQPFLLQYLSNFDALSTLLRNPTFFPSHLSTVALFFLFCYPCFVSSPYLFT
ncbi:hypothetical protein BKA57DRAFT_222954 [Linnemannia elongata]|nr:hypothetical protein BKA57DRAFT_222954 [Linnemannia elongata]